MLSDKRGTMPDIDVAIASRADRPALENMLQFYVHDFSELWAGRRDGELDQHGRFARYPLDDYWQNRGKLPLLFWRDGHPVGFALLDRTSHTGAAPDRNMREFFVVRKHRRSGTGTAAAHAIFSRYPGSWETAVVRRNIAALAFWRKAVGCHPRARDIEELDIASGDWDGPVLRFRIDDALP